MCFVSRYCHVHFMIQKKSSSTLQASLFMNIWARLNNSINNIWAADILIKLLLFFPRSFAVPALVSSFYLTIVIVTDDGYWSIWSLKMTLKGFR